MKRIFLAALLATALTPALAAPAMAESQVRYAAPDNWVGAPPHYALPQRQQGAFTLLLRDMQVYRDTGGVAVYESSRFRINTAEALTLGNLSLQWNPAAGGPVVHALRIHRDGAVIDVLQGAKFSIFQREGALEQSMLDGLLTANLQVPGLRVGDELEFSVTTHSLDPTLGDHAFGLMMMPGMATPGTYRLKLQWNAATPLTWRASPEIADAVVVRGNSVTAELRGPGLINLPERAPLRYAFQRYLNFTDFADWQAVSARLHPLYVQAATLSAGSELKAEATRIAARHKSPADRARAALKLVQDQVRYVYVGMDGANLTPAAADETWQRRYGDCKGKTALLLALLAELGIDAQAVLANVTTGSDGADQLLPSPGPFDHVLVRATIDGKGYWLDGTLQGDGRLLEQPIMPFKFVLPLTSAGVALEQLPFVPPAFPSELNLHAIDASAGRDAPAQYTLTRILRGAEALQLRTALQALPEGSVDPALREFFGGETSWHDLQSVDWQYDEARGALILTGKGTDDIEWDEAGRDWITSTDLPGAGFFPPPERKRPASQDAAAPYVNDPTRFACHVTTLKLPDAGQGRSWEHTAGAMNRTIGGVTYWRMADLRSGEVHTVMSTRTVDPEISAADAALANAEIPDFDNSISTVQLLRRSLAGTQLAVDGAGITRVPAVRDVDWLANVSACIPPR